MLNLDFYENELLDTPRLIKFSAINRPQNLKETLEIYPFPLQQIPTQRYSTLKALGSTDPRAGADG